MSLHLLVAEIELQVSIGFDSEMFAAQLLQTPKDTTFIVESGRMEAEAIDSRLSDVAAWLGARPLIVFICDIVIDRVQLEAWILCRLIEELFDD